MLRREDIELTGAVDELLPKRPLLELAVRGERMESPMRQPTLLQIVLMTIGLAVIATPICLMINRSAFPQQHCVGPAHLHNRDFLPGRQITWTATPKLDSE